MPNVLSKAVSAIWEAIKSAAFWVGRTIESAFLWVFDQLENLWSNFYKSSETVIVKTCKANGVPEDEARKKVEKVLKESKDFLDRQLDKMAELIMELNPCKGGATVEHELVIEPNTNKKNKPLVPLSTMDHF